MLPRDRLLVDPTKLAHSCGSSLWAKILSLFQLNAYVGIPWILKCCNDTICLPKGVKELLHPHIPLTICSMLFRCGHVSCVELMILGYVLLAKFEEANWFQIVLVTWKERSFMDINGVCLRPKKPIYATYVKLSSKKSSGGDAIGSLSICGYIYMKI